MDYLVPAVVSTVLLVIVLCLLVFTRMEMKRREEYWEKALKDKDAYRRELCAKHDTQMMELREEYRNKVAIVRVGDKEKYPRPTESDLALVEKELTRKGFEPEKVLVVPWYLSFDTIQSLASARKPK